jgi:hypothetical protein
MSFRYQPSAPPEKELRAWLADELRRISNAIGVAEFLQLAPIDVEPARPSKGMVVWAVGSNWNPGAGQGMYVYNAAGTWDKVN